MRVSSLPLIAAILLSASAASAQLGGSAGYKFYDAIKKADGEAATKILSAPGSTVVNYQDPSTGETPLQVVIKRQDMTYLRFLLQSGADPNMKDRAGDTPALLAVAVGFDAALPWLAKARADLDRPNSHGETPLIRAVNKHDLSLVRDLLELGADPDRRDIQAGKSAREYAIENSRWPEIAKVIAETPKKQSKAVSGPKL